MNNQNKASFIPFHALNEFMRIDYRQSVVQTVLLSFQGLPDDVQTTIIRLTKKLVQVPGFRNSAAAPAQMRVKPTIRAFEKSPEMVAAILNGWALTKPELRQRVFDLLTARGWELLPPEADRSKLPGFLTHWPDGEDFSIVNKAFSESNPDFPSTTDDVSLMVVWLSGRLPIDSPTEGDANEET